MSTFDPMAVAIDWLDAYRAASVAAVLELHDAFSIVECGCAVKKVIFGELELAAYWQQRFQEEPASELVDLQEEDDAVVVTYQVPKGTIEAKLFFSLNGKIARLVCNPIRDEPSD